MAINVLFLPQGPIEYPSSRYRLYQFLPHLVNHGVRKRVLTHPKPPDGGRARLTLDKMRYGLTLIAGLLWADVVFVQKRIPTVRVRRLIKALNRSVVFDFDDAIYTINPSKEHEFTDLRLAVQRSHDALSGFISDCEAVVVGNRFLADFASQYNDVVVVIPTVVDTNVRPRSPTADVKKVVVGWIGASNNLYYLRKLDNVFAKLHSRYASAISLKVICDSPYDSASGIDVINEPWSLDSEISALSGCDIGLMPLVDDEWNRGKCAFKMIFCMLLGIPVVTSPVGVNKDIIRDGENGYTASSDDEWLQKLCALIDDGELRMRMGSAGRGTIEKDFSLQRYVAVLAGTLARVAK